MSRLINIVSVGVFIAKFCMRKGNLLLKSVNSLYYVVKQFLVLYLRHQASVQFLNTIFASKELRFAITNTLI